MPDMNFSLKLLGQDKLQKDILLAIHKHTKKYFKNNAGYLESSIANSLMDAMRGSPTIKELESGRLREELGVEIANTWALTMAVANSVELTVKEPKIVGSKITAHIRLKAGSYDMDTLTSGHEEGVQETEKGQELPWLKWLTSLGDSVIVRDYSVKAGFPDKSRTGDKIMVKGGGWRVPPSHSGTENDNFVTRAIDQALPEMEKNIIYYFKGALGVS